jgi:hypothetical protein
MAILKSLIQESKPPNISDHIPMHGVRRLHTVTLASTNRIASLETFKAMRPPLPPQVVSEGNK